MDDLKTVKAQVLRLITQEKSRLNKFEEKGFKNLTNDSIATINAYVNIVQLIDQNN